MKPCDYQHVKLRELKRSDNGRPYWAVEWRPERGDRRRRLFSDPVQAREEADHIEKLFSNGLRVVAELPLQKMIGIALMLQQIPNVPIHEIIQFYLQAHGINGAAHTVTLEDAGKQFIESRSDPENYSDRWRKDVRQHIGRLIVKFGKRYVNTIKAEDLENYIANDVGGAPRTRLNHITTLAAFGHWMRAKKKWLPFAVLTAFEEVERPKCRTKDKEIYTPEQMMRLLVFTPMDMVPFMTTGAFGGMRAAERMRLEDEHWQPDNGQFALSSGITKTQRRRIVEAQPNLKEWIDLAGHITPCKNAYDKTPVISKAAGVPWKYNALRSSFASYHLQKFKNEALTAMLDGHSVQELNTSYKGLTGVNDRTAEEWSRSHRNRLSNLQRKKGYRYLHGQKIMKKSLDNSRYLIEGVITAMNQPDSKKRKFTYFEFEDVFADLQKMAKEETARCGHVVTIPELIRRNTLKQVNAYRTKHGQKPLDYDPSAGKFAPAGVGSATQAVVDMKGKLVAYDRNGNKLPEWKTVQDIPHLLRLSPRCKIIYASPKVARRRPLKPHTPHQTPRSPPC